MALTNAEKAARAERLAQTGSHRRRALSRHGDSYIEFYVGDELRSVTTIRNAFRKCKICKIRKSNPKPNFDSLVVPLVIDLRKTPKSWVEVCEPCSVWVCDAYADATTIILWDAEPTPISVGGTRRARTTKPRSVKPTRVRVPDALVDSLLKMK